MAEETIISWNATNWITIVLMVAISFAVLGAVAKFIRSKQSSSDA